MGALGTSISAGILLNEVRGAPAPDFKAINPVSQDEALRLIEAITARLPDPPPWLLRRDVVLAAAGVNSLFKLCSDVLAHHAPDAAAAAAAAAGDFTLPQAERALALCVGRPDAELRRACQAFPRAEGPHVVVPKLSLLVAVMRRARLGRVRGVACVGSCAGLLASDAHW